MDKDPQIIVAAGVGRPAKEMAEMLIKLAAAERNEAPPANRAQRRKAQRNK